MTLPVISNPFEALRVNSVRDLSLILFSKERFISLHMPVEKKEAVYRCIRVQTSSPSTGKIEKGMPPKQITPSFAPVPVRS
jgi:hypothetical protein